MNHNVYFWLKSDLSAESVALFESELKLVTQISYLAKGDCGKPAATAHRPVTDHSFSYSLSLEFKTMADHDFYQTDCVDHKRFVDTCKSLWERVIIYDSESLS